jgi:hypothetical protein
MNVCLKGFVSPGRGAAEARQDTWRDADDNENFAVYGCRPLGSHLNTKSTLAAANDAAHMNRLIARM